MNRRLALSVICLAAALTASSHSAFAMFMSHPEVPVTRLLKNVKAYVREHPKDPHGYYLLGRINALAFKRRSKTIRAREKVPGSKSPLPYLDPWQSQASPAQGAPSDAQLRKHLLDAIGNYRKAIAIKPGESLYHLGLAWIIEAGAVHAADFDALPWLRQPTTAPSGGKPGGKPPKSTTQQAKRPTQQVSQKVVEEVRALVLKLGHKNYRQRKAAQKRLEALMPAAAQIILRYAKHKDVEVKSRVIKVLGVPWREKAIEQYFRAYELAVKKDLAVKRRPPRGLKSLVSYEAGQSWMRLVKLRGIRKGERKKLDDVAKRIKALKAKPRGWITPIIFSLKPHTGLRELLAEDKTVRFDLDGTGRSQRWQWVKPTTGILVWDPNGKGKITSGRQLFGSVTWWMFWTDGYHALGALDDNRDGRLSGRELKGLAVWFDRNTNGVSDDREVVSLGSLGITSLATLSTGKSGASPMNSLGLRLRSGHALPTYDWVARRAK